MWTSPTPNPQHAGLWWHDFASTWCHLADQWENQLDKFLKGQDLSSATACRSTLVVPPLCVVSPVSRKTSQPMCIFWHITSKYGSNHGRRSFLLCLVWSGFGEVQLVGGGTSRHGGHKVVVRWRTATDNKWDNDRAPCGETYSAKYDQTIWRN